MSHSIYALLIVLIAPATAPSASPATAPASASPADTRVRAWQEDLQTLAEELPKRHVNAFAKRPREKFDADVAALRDRLPELDDQSTIVAMMQLVATLGDAHTSIHHGSRPQRFHQYPLAFYMCADGPFVALTLPGQRELLGAKVVGIGSASFDDAAKRVQTVFAFENKSHWMNSLPRWMNTAEVLFAVGLSDRAERATFVLELLDATTRRVELAPLENGAKVDFARLPNRTSPTRPISYRGPTGAIYWYHFSEPDKLLYCRYDSCANDPRKPFADFAKELLALIDANDIQKFVLDLRGNGGGDSRIAQPLIDGIRARKKIDQKGRIFVLIGRATFSSGQLNARDFRKKTNAILVGEPTGQKPNAFGEVKSFELPNSNLVVQYSTKYFRTQFADPPSMDPDVLIEPTSKEYFSGRDIVLEHVLNATPAGNQ